MTSDHIPNQCLKILKLKKKEKKKKQNHEAVFYLNELKNVEA